jgi:small subunit ribosomal protein S1
LPTSEVSWTSKKRQLKDKDEIEAVVVKIQENGFVMLSIKRLQEDPWVEVLKRFQVGMKVKGKIQLVKPFGLIVDLGDSTTALLHKTNIGIEKEINWFEHILIGNILEVEIMEIDNTSRKISLKCDSFFEQYPKRTK